MPHNFSFYLHNAIELNHNLWVEKSIKKSYCNFVTITIWDKKAKAMKKEEF